MKTRFIITAFLFIFAVIFCAKSQEMKPPAPVENKTFDMAVGDWVAEPYEMMGMKWTGEVSHKWVHNHQFLDANIVNTADNGMKYTASGYFTADKDGNLTGWFFDDWGLAGVAVATGKAEGNTVTINSKTDWGSMKRVGTFSENKIELKWTMTMKGPDGKDVTQNGTIIFNRKK